MTLLSLKRITVVTFLVGASIDVSSGFTATMWQEAPAMPSFVPSKTEGVEIELPDFDELFNRIQQVSPLARLAIEGGTGGFENCDYSSPKNLKWKNLSAKKKAIVHHIDKIDNFQGLGCPIVRFRSTLKGPCIGSIFAGFVMNLDEREKWDPQIKEVEETYPIYDVEAANLAMNFKYGDCKKLGIGYCQTKSNIVVDGREQLTLCGIQSFASGATLIWGTEMEETHNHLLPDCERHTRAKSHLFSTVLVPSGPDSFDVEYVLQLEVGGSIPGFLTQPILIETVKSLFKHADTVYQDKEILAPYLMGKEELFL
mmetsp:Transcript_20799/g.23583  ORF Transcript_20799/g.23583 Transcript_20799/m.23583 type:complete len:312 (+) Transcript_20799:259-1194(+)